MISDTEGLIQQLLLDTDFTREEMKKLGAIAELKDVAASTVILKEGDKNERLMLLLKGSVKVLRLGETIATIDTPGGLLGEMSLLTNKPCSATIRAETPVELLSIDISQASKFPTVLRDKFLSATHKLFAVILAEKLAATNEKARLFEITNRELQRMQSALESASSNRIEELARSLKSMAAKVKGSSAEPKPTHVLIAEDDAKEQIHSRMSLGGTGAICTLVANEEELRKASQDSGKPIDVACLATPFLAQVPKLREKHPAARVVLMTSANLKDQIGLLRQLPDTANVLVRQSADRPFSMRNLATTVTKLGGADDIFGLDKYLNWGADIIEKPVTGSAGRNELVKGMEDYFRSVGAAGRIMRKCISTAEEMLMNAIYDAPTGPDGKSLYNHLTRDIPVALAAKDYAVFRYACDGTVIAISVEDRFGSLTREAVLKYLERCLSGNVGEDITGKGGGGNGLFQILSSATLVVFNVKAGKRTEVIALFSTAMQFEQASLVPSFQFFEAR